MVYFGCVQKLTYKRSNSYFCLLSCPNFSAAESRPVQSTAVSLSPGQVVLCCVKEGFDSSRETSLGFVGTRLLSISKNCQIGIFVALYRMDTYASKSAMHSSLNWMRAVGASHCMTLTTNVVGFYNKNA